MADKPKKSRMRPFPLPQLTPEGGLPYEALAPFGAHYDASMRVINRSGLNAQRQAKLTPERRRAWIKLRSSEKRLAVDFYYLQPDPAAFGEDDDAAEALPEPGPPPLNLPSVEPPSPDTIAEATGEVARPPAEPIEPGEPPPLRPAMWSLIREAWVFRAPPLPPLDKPDCFLEEDE